MVDCEYCGASVEDEDTYLEHLANEHAEECGRIDRRRLAEAGLTADRAEQRRSPVVVYGLALSVTLLVIGALGFAVTADGPDDQVHEHGQIDVVVDGEAIDFDQPQYDYDRHGGTFHFHEGDGNIWHMHSDRVTLEEAMADIEMPITEESIEIHGESYDGGEPTTTVDITIDDEPAALTDELHDGDHVRIEVETDDDRGLPSETTAG